MSRVPRARRTWAGRRHALVLLGLVVAFVAGIGLGEALQDGPGPGRGQTILRTLLPRTIPVLPAETATVTGSNR